RGQRDVVLFAVAVVATLGAFGTLALFLGLFLLLAFFFALLAFGGLGAEIDLRRIGGVEIDDVAQQHLRFDQRVMPFEQRADRHRAFADAADHHLAAGFDALGDGDFAFARQELHRAHLAQIHAHGVVGAAEVFLVHIAGDLFLAVGGLFGRRLFGG